MHSHTRCQPPCPWPKQQRGATANDARRNARELEAYNIQHGLWHTTQGCIAEPEGAGAFRPRKRGFSCLARVQRCDRTGTGHLVQMRLGRAQSRRRCGWGETSPGADAARTRATSASESDPTSSLRLKSYRMHPSAVPTPAVARAPARNTARTHAPRHTKHGVRKQ
jgi:hypothetical protein